MIDIAGAYSKALIMALLSADFVIIPAKVSEADLHEALKVVGDIKAVERKTRRALPYRLLLNECDTFKTKVMTHVLGEIDGAGVPRFQTMIMKRTIYREFLLNGQAPHMVLADEPSNKAAQKSVAEIDAVLDEIDAILPADEPFLSRVA